MSWTTPNFYSTICSSLRRRTAAARPNFGEAYWSLANLKTYGFTDAELNHMRREEACEKIALADRYHLCFAIGNALEDRAVRGVFSVLRARQRTEEARMPLPARTVGT